MNKFPFLSLFWFLPIYTVFNPTAGTPVWNIAAETGIIASAIEGTQTRIQQSDLVGGTYTISSPGRYAIVENLTAPAGAMTINITANNVYLDLNGFTIDGTGGGTDIINAASGTSNIFIGNGTLINAVNTAVNIRNNSSNILVDNIHVANSAGVGFQIQDADCFLQYCSTTNSAAAGISLNTAERVVITHFTSDSDGVYGINVLNSRDVSISDVSIIGAGTAGIHTDTISENITIENADLLNINGDGIQVNDTTGLIIKNIAIVQPTNDALSLLGTTSVVSIEQFDIFEPGANGITISNSIFNLCIEDGCIIGAGNQSTAYGIEATQNNGQIFINSVDIIRTSSHAMYFTLPGQAIELVNCKAIHNTGHGVYFNTASPAGGIFSAITVEACTSINNDGSGFLFEAPGTSVFSIIINNCIANFNGMTGFTATLRNGLLSNNIANGNQKNFVITQPNGNTIVGNIGSNPAIVPNFSELAAGNADMYLNNLAWDGFAGFSVNYSMISSVVKESQISSDGSVTPAIGNMTHWTNINSNETGAP